MRTIGHAVADRGSRPSSTKRLALGLFIFVIALAPFQIAHAAADLLLMSKVRLAQSNGDPDKAIELLETVLEQTGADDHAASEALQFEIGRVMSKAGRDLDAAYAYGKLAVEMSKRLGRMHPDVAPVFEAAGAAFERAGELGSAAAAYARAFAIDSSHYPAGSDAVKSLAARLASLSEQLGNKADFQKYSAIAQTAETTREAPKQPAGRGVTVSSDYAEADEGAFTRVKIYYATDRARTGSLRPNDFFGSDRGSLSYGSAEVSVPRSHKPGAVEVPTLISFEVTENPEKHVVVQRIATLDREETLSEMREHLSGRGSDEAFVFVHGYNVSFSWAAKRTAQLAYDLNFEGLPILYSWPSRASALDYLADSAVVRLSGRRLSGFLDDIVASSGAKRIHLIAHSMGNQALTDALELFALRHDEKRAKPAFEQVLFTAPDMDAGLFAEMIKTIRPVAKRMTLYASKNDLALFASRQLHGDVPRAGQGGDDILVSEGLDSVDMSALGEDMLGHDYFADHASALTDMLSLFWRDTEPTSRCGMVTRSKHDRSYWLFDPKTCRGSVALSALTLLKSKGREALDFTKTMLRKWRLDGNERAVAEWRELESLVGSLLHGQN